MQGFRKRLAPFSLAHVLIRSDEVLKVQHPPAPYCHMQHALYRSWCCTMHFPVSESR